MASSRGPGKQSFFGLGTVGRGECGTGPGGFGDHVQPLDVRDGLGLDGSPGGAGTFGMPHLHERIDFTVAIFVVHGRKVLLVHHRRLGKWLPLGGHIELDEDPEQAALREAKEESGLEVELIGDRPPVTEPGTRALIAPRFLDIHRINPTHEHIGMIYFARPALDVSPGGLRLAEEEHHDIRWVTSEALDELQPPLTGAVKWYCRQALRELEQ